MEYGKYEPVLKRLPRSERQPPLGAGSGDLPDDKGYSIPMITDAGVSATVDVIHVRRVKLKEQR